MIELSAAAFACGFFGLLTQRSVLGALLSLQSMTAAAILAMVTLSKVNALGDPSFQSVLGGRAQDAGLILMVVFQLQSIGALVYATRLHYLKIKSGMNELTTMRN